MIVIQLGEKYSDSGTEFSFHNLLQTKAINTVYVTTVNVWIKKALCHMAQLSPVVLVYNV